MVLVLEFTQPPGAIFGALYRFYFTRLLPLFGNLVSRDDDAYSYLARTVMGWPGMRPVTSARAAWICCMSSHTARLPPGFRSR